MKKYVYHISLFFLLMIIMYVMIFYKSQDGTQFKFSIFMHICILGYFTVFNLICFFVMYNVCKYGDKIAYVIPALFSIPVLLTYFEKKFSDNSPGIEYFWISRPLFVSTRVCTTGFLVYQKWIDKSK